jgi:hypothetical protein
MNVSFEQQHLAHTTFTRPHKDRVKKKASSELGKVKSKIVFSHMNSANSINAFIYRGLWAAKSLGLQNHSSAGM